jgi:P-type Cu+ transporter
LFDFRFHLLCTAAVSLALQEAHIEYDPSLVQKTELIDTIEAIGYDVVQSEGDNNNNNRGSESDNDSGHSVVEFTVTGMTCSMCVQSIQRALSAVDGVVEANVTLTTNTAHVVYDSNTVNLESLRESIEDVGYDVVDTSIVGSTGRNNNNGNSGNPPVTEDRLERLLKQQQEEVNNRKLAFVWSLIGTIPILIITMVLSHFPSFSVTRFLNRTVNIPVGTHGHEFILEALLLWALCTPIQFGCGWPFYRSSYFGLRQGIMGMDVLVAVGTSASYGYAVWATFTPGSMEYHFFETSAVLICFVLLGKWMQTMAVRRTSQALTQLLQLQPKTAIKVVPKKSKSDNTPKSKAWNPLINDPYTEEVVPISSIEKGDFVKILKGASIPADGIIRFGEITVDESMITVSGLILIVGNLRVDMIPTR